MATIKTIDVKGWVDKGSPVYSMSVGIEYDWMPMTPDQMDAVKLQAEQLKGLIENQLMTWNGGAPAGEFKTAETTVPTKEQKPAEPNEPGLVLCSICKSSTEERISVRGVPYRYCPQCKDTRRLDGTPFPPKKK